MVSHSSENTSTDPDPGGTAGRVESTSTPPSTGGSVPVSQSLREDLAVLLHEIGVLVQATWDRMRLGVRSTARSLCAGVVVFVVVTFFLARAASSVLDGLRGAFTQLSGSAWCGDLFAGLLCAGGVVLAYWMSGRRGDRETSRELRAKYDAPPSIPNTPPVDPPPVDPPPVDPPPVSTSSERSPS